MLTHPRVVEVKTLGWLIKMLSSIAEKTYWLSRYIERIENTSRLINVNTDLLLDIPHDDAVNLKHLIQINYFESKKSSSKK